MTEGARIRTHGGAIARRSTRCPRGGNSRFCPAEVELRPEEEREITVKVTAPDLFTGRQAINLNAYDGDRLAGGVTLYAQG